MCPWSWCFTLALLFSRCMRNMRNSKQDTSQVLSDLGLSDKAATIDLRQLSLLINDEIIQSQVWSAGWLWWWNEIYQIVQKSIKKNGDLKEWRAKIFQYICLQIHTSHSSFISFHQILALNELIVFTFQDIISFPTVTAAIATFQSEVAAFTSSLHLKAVESD